MFRAAALALAAALLAAGCGGSSADDATEEPADGTLEALWRAPGDDVAIVPGAADFGPGRVRLTVLGIDDEGRVVTRPTARVWVARALAEKPFAETTARAEPIGVESSEEGDAEDIFVAHLDLPEPGTYWVLAEPVGGRKIQAVGNVVVSDDPAAPAVGEKAIASETPTIASTGGDFAALTTADPPDRELLEYSVADSLKEGVPFVLTFATPRYCQTRTCGPVVDVVDAVRKQYEDEGIRFIHVEIYEGNDPANDTNQWVREWTLPSEPFTVLVGADGVITERFEGTVSVRELGEAVEQQLVSA